ncbi:MAG: DUF4391 domain-containing protein [Clostridium sp.]|uniref:DUF4391 domain-containing protein n=1 Tax=Clostridium sp. TaxID=1506 RepID=UPI002671AC80|nr:MULTISPECIES: DUF4391 domain-containing protein [Clostridium]MDU4318612.1 DUF4391 domain-containing protein [Clostridium sp.]MDU6809278.1 DUF4391 domain-containing protein [Clostridium sp.]
MFDLNNKTVVNRSFKIREIFKMINADKDLKRDAEVIKKINLANVISKETLNIKSNESCREIYVFNITLKEKRIPIDFIKTFDKNIELHTYFIFEHEDEFKELCIYRYVQDSNIKRGRIYESAWGNKESKELPYCINICEIYNSFILNLVDLKIRENENINDFLERLYNIEQLRKEISTLEKKAFKESQPRKKFDIGREVKIKKEKLKGLEGE